MKEQEETYLLVDVSGLLYRAYFSLGQLKSPSGEPTGALYGFIKSFLKVVRLTNPQNVIAVFDGPKNKESRLALYSEYKAHRKPISDELVHQIQEAKRFCKLWGMPLLAVPGVEADDVLATLDSFLRREKKARVIICSHDKDLFQLLGPHTTLFNPAKETILDENSFTKEWGITPKQSIDYLAIIGDSSDNVPGIAGFGPKTALQLLQEWGSLEKIYQNVDSMAAKKREKLLASKDSAFLSRSLVQLDDKISLPHDLLDQEKTIQEEEAKSFFKEKGFHTLLSLLPSSPTDNKQHHFSPRILTTKEDLASYLSLIPDKGHLSIDIETTSLEPLEAQVVGVGMTFSEREGDVCYIPTQALPIHEITSLLNHEIKEKSLCIVGHNLKFDLAVLKQFGLSLPKNLYDTLLASWISRSHERTHGLDVLVRRVFEKEMIPIESLIGKGKKQKTMDQVPLEQIAPYCGADAHFAFLLYQHFEKELKGSPLEKVLHTIEFPLLPILLEMEERGVYVSKEHLEKLGTHIEQKQKEAEQAIFSLADASFNINSPKQLAEILYDRLKLPIKRKRAKPRSTDAETLEQLYGIHPIIEKLLEYRQLEKLRSTYIEVLLEKVHTKTGRVHCHFMQAGTTTGRLACQEPNLQNIPIKTELGKQLREAFRPQKPHWKMLSSDYSQIELRILAHISQDESLIQAFLEKKDIHAQTASQVFHVPLQSVTDEMRRKAKAVNFGILYGQQAFGLSQELHIPLKEAQEFIDRYFATYPRVQETIAQLKEMARKKGYAETLMGRRRALPEINSPQAPIRSIQERLAINTPFQGLAADIIKLAMLQVDASLKQHHLQTKMVLQIHDELLFEVPDEEIEKASAIIKKAMEEVLSLSVPLTVEIGIGKNWREC